MTKTEWHFSNWLAYKRVPKKPKPNIEVPTQLLSDWNLSAKILIPHSPALLRPIVKALLSRIGQHNQKEAKFLRIMIRNLVVVELEDKRSLVSKKSLPPLSLVFRYMSLRMLLSKKPRSGHYLPMLHIQKTLLIHFIEKNPIQHFNITRWVSRHEKVILALLIPLPCLCNYVPSLISTGFTASDCGNSNARLISSILAHIHGSSTPANIEKLLKKPFKMYRIEREDPPSLIPKLPLKRIKSS